MVEGCLLILLAGARQELFQGEKEPDGSTAAVEAVQVAQETADLIRADLGIDAERDVLRRAAESEDPLRRLEAEFAGGRHVVRIEKISRIEAEEARA